MPAHRTTSRPLDEKAAPGALRRRHFQRDLVPRTLARATGHVPTAETLLDTWWEGKASHTRRNYGHDLEDFAAYLSGALSLSLALSVPEALTRLWEEPAASAHEIALGFRAHLRAAHLSAASINRHLATLRSLAKCGRLFGLVTWSLDVPNVRNERRRHTRCLDATAVRQMLAATNDDTAVATRNAAIVTTLYCLGLRVSELCGLDLEHTDFARGYAWVRGKGRREREPVPLPAPVVDAWRRYVRHRGDRPGPLLQGHGRTPAHSRRLSARTVLRIVRALGLGVGVEIGCHSLRHSSITQAAELGPQAGVGLDQIRAHSRHRSIATLMVYVHARDRTQTQRTLADLVASTLAVDPSLTSSEGESREDA